MAVRYNASPPKAIDFDEIMYLGERGRWVYFKICMTKLILVYFSKLEFLIHINEVQIVSRWLRKQLS
jgi:hypothetical protein